MCWIKRWKFSCCGREYWTSKPIQENSADDGCDEPGKHCPPNHCIVETLIRAIDVETLGEGSCWRCEAGISPPAPATRGRKGKKRMIEATDDQNGGEGSSIRRKTEATAHQTQLPYRYLFHSNDARNPGLLLMTQNNARLASVAESPGYMPYGPSRCQQEPHSAYTIPRTQEPSPQEIPQDEDTQWTADGRIHQPHGIHVPMKFLGAAFHAVEQKEQQQQQQQHQIQNMSAGSYEQSQYLRWHEGDQWNYHNDLVMHQLADPNVLQEHLALPPPDGYYLVQESGEWASGEPEELSVESFSRILFGSETATNGPPYNHPSLDQDFFYADDELAEQLGFDIGNLET